MNRILRHINPGNICIVLFVIGWILLVWYGYTVSGGG